MIGYENKDSSFFALEVPGTAALADSLVSGRVKSFTVTEEMGKMKTGSIVFEDADNLFSGILKTGVKFMLTWGYKKAQDMLTLDAVLMARAMMTAGCRVMGGFFMSPSGGGSASGQIDYTATFYGEEYASASKEKLYSSGTKQLAVLDALAECGIVPTNAYIDWDSAKDMIMPVSPLRRTGKPYEWLQRQAQQSKVFFDIGYDIGRQKLACWIDTHKIGSATMALYTNRIVGNVLPERFAQFAFRNFNPGVTGINDVDSFTWSQNVGENGTGDNVQMMYQPNGKVTFFRSVAGTKYVTAYELDPAAIKKYQVALDKSGTLAAGTIALLQQDFNHYVKLGFFVQKRFSTAPEGFGFKIGVTLKTGNPALYVGQQCKFQGDFPSPFKDQGNTFYIQKLDHEFSGGRYTQRVDIADCFTITGGSLIAAFKGMN